MYAKLCGQKLQRLLRCFRKGHGSNTKGQNRTTCSDVLPILGGAFQFDILEPFSRWFDEFSSRIDESEKRKGRNEIRILKHILSGFLTYVRLKLFINSVESNRFTKKLCKIPTICDQAFFSTTNLPKWLTFSRKIVKSTHLFGFTNYPILFCTLTISIFC